MTVQVTTQDWVLSDDRTRIAFTKAGSGPALILVHGTGADRTRWAGVTPRLAQDFTTYSIDRRGHGSSGDAAEYSIQREYEDIAAAAGAVEGPWTFLATLLGRPAFWAPRSDPQPAPAGPLRAAGAASQHTPEREDLLRRMDAALEAGDREAVVLILMNEMLRIPMAMIDKARATPAWAGQLAAAHTIPRELRSSNAYGADPEAIRRISARTLFLLGGASLESFKVTIETLHSLLPDSRVVILPGQQHSAMLTAPDLFVREVTQFLLV